MSVLDDLDVSSDLLRIYPLNFIERARERIDQ